MAGGAKRPSPKTQQCLFQKPWHRAVNTLQATPMNAAGRWMFGIVALALLSASCAAPPRTKDQPMARVEEQDFGRLPDGRPVKRFTLTNRHGMSAKVITYGAILTELHVPDRNGSVTNVVHGFADLASYLQGHPF